MGKQRVAGRDPEATREPGRDLNLPSSGEDEHGDAQAWGVLMAVVEVIADGPLVQTPFAQSHHYLALQAIRLHETQVMLASKTPGALRGTDTFPGPHAFGA
jgi:hypothetical protein